jgi:uncharacterized protein GlcG (DUF336 family)
VKPVPTLTYDDAVRAVRACHDKASQLHAAVAIAVVDAGGGVIALTRMDGARPYTVDLATRKARTATAIGIDTAGLQQHLGSSPLSAEVLAVPGGLPCVEGSMPAGGIGISGALPEVDVLIAQAGIDAIRTAMEAGR